MKSTLKYTLCLLALGSFFGCGKFLETLPDNRIDLSNPENITVNAVSELLVNAYPKANYMAFCEAMSDNVGDKKTGSTSPTNYAPYSFQDYNSEGYDLPLFYWTEAYKAIAMSNLALEAIGKVKDTASYSAQKGEALVARAYAHFMLLNLFSKPYDPSTSSTDLGIPYVTQPETQVYQHYERKTVSYVYDMIEQDLLKGLPLIQDKYAVPRYHFTKAAANAFAARFYLFKQNYTKAVEYASKVFPSGNFASSMRNLNDVTYKNAETMQIAYAKSTEKANLLLVETASVWARYLPYYRFGLTTDTYSKIYSSNVTGGTYNYSIFGSSQYLNIPKFYEHFVQDGISAQTGFPYNTIVLFSTEEVLLNRAEAYANIGNTTKALEDLNTFAQNRITNYSAVDNTLTEAKVRSYYQTTDTKKALVSAVLDFKRAEFTFEGMRWFDILRHKIEVKHVYFDSTLTISASDPRRQLQLPPAATLSGLELNPRP